MFVRECMHAALAWGGEPIEGAPSSWRAGGLAAPCFVELIRISGEI